MKDEEPLALDIDSRSRINVTTLRTNSALKKASFREMSRPLRQKLTGSTKCLLLKAGCQGRMLNDRAKKETYRHEREEVSMRA